MKDKAEKPILECVPNFSEGRDQLVIEKIAAAVRDVTGVSLLNVDPGYTANRTVFTFAGTPDAVVEAAFRSVQAAAENIDMRKQKGEHPRIGAADVVPLIPVSGMTMNEVVKLSEELAKRVGDELEIPVYLYEESASNKQRKNLASIRYGGYEGLEEKMQLPNWKPDFGPGEFNPHSGATVIGARKILVAWNVNLDTENVTVAREVAAEVRERGGIKKLQSGETVFDEHGDPVYQPGVLKHLKAIGWYIEDFRKVQVSMNLIDYTKTGMHTVFETVEKAARKRGVSITGSELIGMLPLKALYEAGVYFLQKEGKASVREEDAVEAAVKHLGLDELSPFFPEQKILEYAINRSEKESLYSNYSLRGFSEKISAVQPTPAGGSVAAYVNALAASLAAMTAEINIRKKPGRAEMLHNIIHKMHLMKNELLVLVDEDSEVYNDFVRLRREVRNDPRKKKMLEETVKKTVKVPLKMMEIACEIIHSAGPMCETGIKAIVPDVLSAALFARAALGSSYLNVQANLKALDKAHDEFKQSTLSKAGFLLDKSNSGMAELKKNSTFRF